MPRSPCGLYREDREGDGIEFRKQEYGSNGWRSVGSGMTRKTVKKWILLTRKNGIIS